MVNLNCYAVGVEKFKLDNGDVVTCIKENGIWKVYKEMVFLRVINLEV